MRALRKFEIRVSSGAFREIRFEDLRKDNVFRAKNPDGTPVKYRGSDLMRASSDPYEVHYEADEWNEAGLRWTIDSISEKEFNEFKNTLINKPQEDLI